jgi:hypothetical protein
MQMVLFRPVEDADDGSYFKSNSLSGGERNRLFIRKDGNYKDLSLVSGADFRQDGRGFVLFDYDNDGWIDIGITSPNKPRFRLLRNQFAELPGEVPGRTNGFVSLQLVGGQTDAEPSIEWSPRDPIGATVMVKIGSTNRKYQLSCGEGLSSQNTNRIHIGLGSAQQIERIEIQWPSGKTTIRKNVPAGSRLKIFENQ